jgi:hypothetical protein
MCASISSGAGDDSSLSAAPNSTNTGSDQFMSQPMQSSAPTATLRRVFRAFATRHWPIMTFLAVILAGTAGTAGTAGARADIFKKEDLVRGVTISRADCDATAMTFWLNVHGHDFCVRYYLSTAGGEGPRPIVFLQGDQLGKFDRTRSVWTEPSKWKDRDSRDLVRQADDFSKMARTTAIYLARIGVDGTSGTHMARKTTLELDLMNAALFALKERYHFDGFHLAGQSGGSRLIAALIQERHDIGCAVMGSGQFMDFETARSSDPGKNYFELDATKVVQDKSLRPILVSDKTDKRVPIGQQTGYSAAMRKAGRPIPQFFVEAPLEEDDIANDEHHGVGAYTELATAGCVLGRSDDEIGRALNTMLSHYADYNVQRLREAKSKPAILAADKGAVPAQASAATPGKK